MDSSKAFSPPYGQTFSLIMIRPWIFSPRDMKHFCTYQNEGHKPHILIYPKGIAFFPVERKISGRLSEFWSFLTRSPKNISVATQFHHCRIVPSTPKNPQVSLVIPLFQTSPRFF
jgi:hypothetical protein